MDATPPAERRLNPTHFLGALAIGMEDVPGLDCRGWSRVRPEMFATGTDRVRIGFLASIVDLVAGNPPEGPLNPTLDLRVQLYTRPPTAGPMRFDLRTLRSTRTMYWGETLLYAGDDQTPFGRSTATFRNNKLVDLEPMRFPAPDIEPDGPIEGMFGIERVGPGRLRVENREAIGNPAVGTIQGGAQATIAEIAAEDALFARTGQRFTVVDLDIRYLDKLRVGPMTATATITPTEGQVAAVTVVCTDEGAEGRLVSHTSLLAISG
jgi:acyl-coenzyme A thioesterase PaaI-like protein